LQLLGFELCYVVVPAKVNVFITENGLLVLGLWLFVPVGFVQFDVAASVLWKYKVVYL